MTLKIRSNARSSKMPVNHYAMLLVLLSFGTAIPFTQPGVLATHLPIDVRDCSFQGPNCDRIYKEATFGFNFIQTWDPAWNYGTSTDSSLLGGVLYDLPVMYKSTDPSLTGLAPTSAIKSIDIANGTYYEFTINGGIHARELDSSGTIRDFGVIRAQDWAYSIQRSIALCNPDGPAPVVYRFVYGAWDWFYGANNCIDNAGNTTALAASWTTFLSHNSVVALDVTHFAIKVDADFNVTNGLQPFTPFLAILANSWAAVYPQSVVDTKCGPITANLAKTCAFMDSAKAIGTGPYLYDESNKDPNRIVLQKNLDYCEGDRLSVAECYKLGPVGQYERPDTIILMQVNDETTLENELDNGTVDHSPLASISYPRFLEANTTPPYNALYSNRSRGEFSFARVPELTIQHLQLLVHRTAEQHSRLGVSPLEGDCSPTPSSGCYVRMAIRAIFNYTNYMNNIIGGLGTRLATFLPDPFPDGNTMAQFNGLPLVTTDVAQAKHLLELAGYNSTNKMPTIICGYNLGNDARARACVSIAASLEATSYVQGVGVYGPASGYLGHVNDRAWEIVGLGWFPDYADEDNYARPYAYTNGTFQVAMGYENATLNNEIDTAAGLPAGLTRQALYLDIERTINNDCQCYIWLQQPEGRSIWTGRVDSRVFLRLVNPAFLPYYLDIHKWACDSCGRTPFTPVFPSTPLTVSFTLALAVGIRLLKKTDGKNPRRIRL